jgi:hypothetical protein
MKMKASCGLVLILAACTGDPNSKLAQAPETPVPEAAKPAEPIATTRGASLAFTAQEGWIVETPANATRKAQYRLPRVPGDAEDATLVVYYFGGQGGSTDANIERWASQFEQPDGRLSSRALLNSTRKVHGMNVHDVELSGTYVAETTPGSGERVRKEGWKMLASILEAPDGPHYAKLVGPAATVTHWEASFRRFVSMTKAAD